MPTTQNGVESSQCGIWEERVCAIARVRKMEKGQLKGNPTVFKVKEPQCIEIVGDRQ
jgi:hypothetical protein